MNDLLKFITCGSVDDGKSTLIGHLLYDAKLIYADQKEALLLDSKVGSRGGAIDYSLLLDGLLAEREQGITIDVAYRYFTTDNRSFICADTPGHEEYTRNMACGASFADLAIILVDATQGVLTQTRRHARICALMGIRYFVFAINKMDLADYSETRFDVSRLKGSSRSFRCTMSKSFRFPRRKATTSRKNLPICPGMTVRLCSNILRRSMSRPYRKRAFICRYSVSAVQTTNSAVFRDRLRAAASRSGTRLPRSQAANRQKSKKFSWQTATCSRPSRGNREVDVSRGCVLEKGSHVRQAANFKAEILWMDDVPLTIGKNFMVFLGTKKIPGILTKIDYRIDINSGEHVHADGLKKNEIAVCEIAVTEPIVLDTFNHHRTQGELILIDRISNMTAACGVVREIPDASEKRHFAANQQMRSALNWQAPLAVAFELQHDGVSLADVEEAEYYLVRNGRHTYLYHPTAEEDYETTLQHLLQAGLVVLLVLDKGQEVPENVRRFAEFAGEDAAKLDSQQIAEKILHHSLLDSMMAPNNWII